MKQAPTVIVQHRQALLKLCTLFPYMVREISLMLVVSSGVRLADLVRNALGVPLNKKCGEKD